MMTQIERAHDCKLTNRVQNYNKIYGNLCLMNACQHFISKKPEAWIVILNALLALLGSWNNIKIIYGLDSTGFISWPELEIFFSQTSSRPALGPNSLLFNGPGLFPIGKAAGTSSQPLFSI
jgi:hypothetical protein